MFPQFHVLCIVHSINVNVMLVKKSAIYCTLSQQMFTFIIVMNLNWISILFLCVNEALWINRCNQESNKVPVFVSQWCFWCFVFASLAPLSRNKHLFQSPYMCLLFFKLTLLWIAWTSCFVLTPLLTLGFSELVRKASRERNHFLRSALQNYAVDSSTANCCALSIEILWLQVKRKTPLKAVTVVM